MKGSSIVRQLILLSLRENMKIYIAQIIWAIILGLLVHILDRIFIFRAIPVYFFLLLFSSFLISLQESSTIKGGASTNRSGAIHLYNNVLPLTYFQKWLISFITKSISYFFPIISTVYFIYLLAPMFIDFSGYRELYLFCLVCMFQLFLFSSFVPMMKIVDRYSTVGPDSMKSLKILLINSVAFFGMIVIVLFDSAALKGLMPLLSDYFSTYNMIAFLFVIYNFNLIYKIVTNAKVRNEHTAFRLTQPTIKKQLKMHVINYSILLLFNIGLGVFVYSQVNTNFKAYSILQQFGIVKESYALELLNDRPQEFTNYYRNGMQADKNYKWLDDKLIMATIIENDSVELLKELVPVPIDAFDKYFCQLFSARVCRPGYFLHQTVKSNSAVISSYLLDNPLYHRDGVSDSFLMLTAAQSCNGQSLSALMNSGLSPVLKKDKIKDHTVYDILAEKKERRCRFVMRDLLERI